MLKVYFVPRMSPRFTRILLCEPNFMHSSNIRIPCTKYILHTLSILQHVSSHHTCQHQEVFLAVIITLANGPLCDKLLGANLSRCIYSLITQSTVSKCYNNSYEDSLMLTRAVCPKHTGGLITFEEFTEFV